VLLYEGKGREAFERVTANWDHLSIHLRRSGRLARACTLLMRARAGLAAQAESPDAATLGTIIADSQELRQLGAGFAGFGPVIDAQLACLKGDRALARACTLLMRARAGLAAQAESPDAPTLDSIIADSQALRQLGAGFAGFGPVIDAQLAWLKGDKALARAFFEEAIRSFAHEQSDHALKYVRFRLGELVGDVVGQTSCRDIRAWLEQQGVVNAEHFIRIFVPVSAAARS